MTEAELGEIVRAQAKALRLYAYHPLVSRGSQRGWPDWVLIGPGGALFRELKSAVGRLTSEQRQLGYLLESIGLNWAVWGPADASSHRIEREMRAIAATQHQAATPGRNA